MQGSANLNVMIKAARKAARALVKDFREVENLQVSAKGPGEFVSRADTAAEEILKAELLGARPNYGWLAEEGGGSAGTDPTRRWIVDPLDGTTNFLHGMPHWSVSIALEHKGEIVAGVIYDPAKDEMFFAEKGQGAWLNQSLRLRVSGRTKMAEAVFATGVQYGPMPELGATLQDLARLMPRCAGMRRWGSAALDLAYVAAGRFDGYWERSINLWDIAAGLVIVREAGGLLLADCAQGAGRFALPPCDMAIVSAHKFGGPIGIGALLVRDYAMLEPSGGHERGYRRGTENLPGVLGMAAALEACGEPYVAPGVLEPLDRLAADCRAAGGTWLGDVLADPTPYVRAFAMPGMSGTAQVMRFDMAGFAVSQGSACSSGTMKTSHVLEAMGMDENVAANTIRVSVGWSTTREEVERFCQQWRELAQA
ncbi:MAG: aminotransferase class V-fold PLP-dependent enzyme [Alphaproteobacteria bacterium]|jgi:myo-inositol-1(or 4)-monophosphatase|nr:aminotransferase class V-fold PLP-dependent enzyme [Alphaproteobacteria bacterium]